ncbi:MAG TPA: Flp pilus assembly protein CpaB, partial [Edaphobacter sp.]|nr:Flp pilus assembly protein CpaB [Edaphobacter sp.]
VVGRAVLYPVAAGEPLLDRQLTAAGSGVGLAGKIPEGMRAIALKSDEVVGVAGFLLPGTHVDVLVTFRDNTGPGPLTATALQDVEVLAVGQQYEPDPSSKPKSVDVVTLLLKPQDAEKAVLASSQGTIHFVLRNSADREQASAPPATLSQLTTAQPVKATVARRSAQPTQKAWTVETLFGKKSQTDTFN